MKVALAIALPLLLLACGPDVEPGPARSDDAAVAGLDTRAVERVSIPRVTTFDGVIEAVNQSTVAAQTSGRVVELPFDVGDYVEQGALIVRLTDTEQRSRMAAAEGALAEAQARLAEAQLTYERHREVYEKRLIAKAQFDRAVADFDSARARLDGATAALQEAREALAHTVIHAPYAGTVVARHVQMGEAVQPGTPLMTGLSLEQLRVSVAIPEQHIGPLRRHSEARVLLGQGEVLETGALRIPPNAEAASHSFRVLVDLPAGDYGLFPGNLVKVAFVSGTQERLLIPVEAVVRRGEIEGVYVVEAGRVSLRYVRIGEPADDRRVVVLSGLDAGEQVALDPIAAGVAYKQQMARPGQSS